MDKRTAIYLLGGSLKSAAEAIGITPQAVSAWPDELSDRVKDRVEAALARQQKAARVHEQSPVQSA